MASDKVRRAIEVLSVAGVDNPQIRQHLAQALANADLLVTERLQDALARAEAAEQAAAEAKRAAGRYARLYNSAISKHDAVHALFAGGPDTPCRTTWRDGVECVEVPMEDLRRALDGTP